MEIGAPDMAFPKLNAASYWSYFAGGVVMMSSFFSEEDARSGWTSYPPLADIDRANHLAYWNDILNYIKFIRINEYYYYNSPITCSWANME